MLGDFEPLDDNTLFIWTDQLQQFKDGGGPLDKQKADEIAKAVIRDFCLRHWHDLPQSRYTSGWIVDVLGEILEHKDAVSAFCLKPRPKGRAKGTGRASTPVAAWVQVALKRGYGANEAYQAAADLFGLSERQVERFVEAHEFYPGADLESYLLGMKNPKPLPDQR
ncbi:hypothetical protein EIP75_05610 [Aquabacterium soli]|uniref:Uncharacterized protein n=1 Tax=Aquabacterium soli TaxID=2493092 RepID=A0A3R8U5H2_9BURK|nr:hypothetical protein [Aquabacterium soli]RRS05055.1 hypothetical protein EIP75_05610 [Aquabacterium soli]